MKLKLDLQNKEYTKFQLGLAAYFMLGIQIMQFESERQAPRFIALGVIIISTVVLKFSTAYRPKVIALYVWVTGLAFMLGYVVTISILE